MGDVAGQIKVNSGRNYVYILSKPDGTPFYVGWGRAGNRLVERVFSHEISARSKQKGRHNRHKIRTIQKIIANGGSVGAEIDSWHDDVASAKRREIALIASIGRADLGRGPLTNMTDGGDGAVNLTEDGRRRMHEGHRKGHAGRLEWIAKNPERMRDMGRRLATKREEWGRANPEKDFAARSKAGSIGGVVAMTRLAAQPLLLATMRKNAGAAGKKWAKDNPEKARQLGSAAFNRGLRGWVASNPEAAREANLLGLRKRHAVLRENPDERAKLLRLAEEGRAKWATQNGDKLRASGRRQADRNREKAEVRRACLEILKTAPCVSDLPSGRAGLAVWQAVLKSLRPLARS